MTPISRNVPVITCLVSSTATIRILFILMILVSSAVNTHAAFEGFFNMQSDFLLNGESDDAKRMIGFSRIDRFGMPELAINRIDMFNPGQTIDWGIGFCSSGDEVYLEQRLSGRCGLRVRDARFYLVADIYRIDIEGYSSATVPGIGLRLDWLSLKSVSFNCGVDGLLTGEIRNGYRDINRHGWGMIHFRAGTMSGVSMMIDVPQYGRTGITLAAEQGLDSNLGCRFLLSDQPSRVGGGVYFNFRFATFSFVLVHLQPLGWSQSAGIRIAW